MRGVFGEGIGVLIEGRGVGVGTRGVFGESTGVGAGAPVIGLLPSRHFVGTGSKGDRFAYCVENLLGCTLASVQITEGSLVTITVTADPHGSGEDPDMFANLVFASM
jgi:hypothetical protein